MTSLGSPLIIVKSVEGCDGGQCGGEITLWTDLVRNAYAVSNPDMGTRYTGVDADLILRKDNGDIEVSCSSVDLGDHVCDGKAVFTHEVLTRHSMFLDPEPHILACLTPMDRE